MILAAAGSIKILSLLKLADLRPCSRIFEAIEFLSHKFQDVKIKEDICWSPKITDISNPRRNGILIDFENDLEIKLYTELYDYFTTYRPEFFTKTEKLSGFVIKTSVNSDHPSKSLHFQAIKLKKHVGFDEKSRFAKKCRSKTKRATYHVAEHWLPAQYCS